MRKQRRVEVVVLAITVELARTVDGEVWLARIALIRTELTSWTFRREGVVFGVPKRILVFPAAPELADPRRRAERVGVAVAGELICSH